MVGERAGVQMIECWEKGDFWEKVLHFRKKVFCLEVYLYFWMLSTALGNTINFFLTKKTEKKIKKRQKRRRKKKDKTNEFKFGGPYT